MIAFYGVLLLLTGAGLGWFTHRAYVRIDAWGKAMNDQDAIFRIASEDELDSALRRIRVLRFEDHVPVQSKGQRFAQR